jgi:hypothetical protein
MPAGSSMTMTKKSTTTTMTQNVSQ